MVKFGSFTSFAGPSFTGQDVALDEEELTRIMGDFWDLGKQA